MPMRVKDTADAGEVHANPFVGPIDHPIAIRVDVSTLTDAEVDDYGYLRPGTPLTRAGTLPGVDEFVFGCVIEGAKVADDNVAATLAAAEDVDVAVTVIGAVNRAILEDNLGRVLTANEIAAFDAAGSKVALLY